MPKSNPVETAPLIAVLSGGYSAEAEISRQSAAVVLEQLRKSGSTAVEIDVARDGWFALPDRSPVDLNDFSFLQAGQRMRPDVAFIAIHGTPGEDGRIQSLLDMLYIPYTGCDHVAAAMTFDKDLCKRAVGGSGVHLAPSLLVRREDNRDQALEQITGTLRFPVFIKPNRNGSSFGVSKVDHPDAIRDALERGFQYDDRLLVESGIPGMEVTCGVYTREGVPQTLPLCEIVPNAEFFDYEAKYTAGAAEEIVPARLSADDADSCRSLSLDLYHRLDCKGLVRFDYLLDQGKFWFLEVNTVPGLSAASIVPKMVQSAGWNLGDFFAHLVREALSSKRQMKQQEA